MLVVMVNLLLRGWCGGVGLLLSLLLVMVVVVSVVMVAVVMVLVLVLMLVLHTVRWHSCEPQDPVLDLPPRLPRTRV